MAQGLCWSKALIFGRYASHLLIYQSDLQGLIKADSLCVLRHLKMRHIPFKYLRILVNVDVDAKIIVVLLSQGKGFNQLLMGL